MKTVLIEWQSRFGGISHRFIVDGKCYSVKWDSRGYNAWYYNKQLYITESVSTLRGNFRDTAAYVLHSDFSDCYPKFPKMDLDDLLKTDKTMICFSTAKNDPWSWVFNDGRIAYSSNSFWYTEWYIGDILMMRWGGNYHKPLKMLRGISEIELFTENTEMVPALLSLFVLLGQNLSSS